LLAPARCVGIPTLDGFEAYQALDCGHGEILSINVFRDQASAESSGDLALQFVGKEPASSTSSARR
jgi:hypothetical protein